MGMHDRDYYRDWLKEKDAKKKPRFSGAYRAKSAPVKRASKWRFVVAAGWTIVLCFLIWRALHLIVFLTR